MRVIRSIPVLENEQKLHAWLRAVTTSCAYDRLRKEKRTRRREAGISPSPGTSDPETMERLAWMEEELAKLDASVHPSMVLRFRLGWTLGRIGKALGLKPGAVDGRIRRATLELQERAANRDE